MQLAARRIQEGCMGKTVAAIAGGAALGIVVAFASAGAFQFPWGSDTTQQGKSMTAAPAAHQEEPAPPGAPEPGEPRQWVQMPSWAPMVKKVMPTVVNVAITQEVKAGQGESEEGPVGGGSGGGGGDQGPGFGGGNPFVQGSPFGPG
jgi:S1-C subfamily serine protease